VSLTCAKDGEDASPVTVEVTQRDAAAANKALELLARHLGLKRCGAAPSRDWAGRTLEKDDVILFQGTGVHFS
jgi:hypothetical protein